MRASARCAATGIVGMRAHRDAHRDARRATHPVMQDRCNRLQTFREGMSATFVAILSFSPAAATGTT
ncbi:hypothetical protein E1J23_01560 [Xanthomonas gardneri]|nr:hypothetical protein BJD10_20060 [Xanthomonas hortorum pv. gardneri]NMI17109.1 hypothetical protein [Xanthomonas hortorum pv. vitians]NMI50658.1 hypothetical protein [Xanthomonas hortorum pv. taraxaci]PPU48196.1 hypothetical protein XcyCFBP4188_06770 [Xanthomonas hortorum pv. cynarae]QEW14499.1 hypothetical protein DYQ48_05315 [Xanthomonas hortorum]